MKLSWGSHALANNVPPHVYVGAGMMPLSQVQRDRPPKSGAGKRKKNAAEGSEIETEEGYLVSISNPDGGDAGQGKSSREKRPGWPRAKKKPTRFKDLSPKESTFPRTG
jgi:hypothetical protein